MTRRRRAAFTLFELILSIALSAVLLAVIGMAINLYLTRVSASRDRVEEAQLARSILAMIADDLRATAIYQPQDVSSVAQLMAQSASFDVDSIDAARSGASGASSASGTPSSISGGASGSGGSSASGSSGGTSGGRGASTSSSGASTPGSSNFESEMPMGINGGIGELYVDIERLPRGDELFSAMTGYTNAPMAMLTDGPQLASGTSWGTSPPPSDFKTVRYFLREGDRSNASGVAATGRESEMQNFTGGLVRQEIPRPARLFAEQNANSAVLDSGQVLVAPEVVHIEFRYFNGGEQVFEAWDMANARALPLAVEVRIWLITAAEADANAAAYDVEGLISIARQYRQTVFLPMAALSQKAAGSGAGGSSSSSPSTNSSTSGSPSSSSSPSSPSSTFGSSTN